MKWLKRLGWAACIAALLLAAAAVYCRLDKTDIFYETRGTYAGADVIETWETAGSTYRLIGLKNESGQLTTAYVRRPKNPADHYKIILTYAGAKTGKKVLGLIPERDDLVLISVQYPYERPRKIGQYLTYPYDLRQVGFRTVGGGMLAVSYLNEAGLDTKRLTVVGASLGSIFATIHGALDNRVPRVLLVHGGGDFEQVIRNSDRLRERGWPVEPVVWVSKILIDTYDPIHYVSRIAPRKLIMISTRRDKYYPIASIEGLYNRAGEPKEIIWTNTDHVRSWKTDIAAEIVDQINHYLDGSKKL